MKYKFLLITAIIIFLDQLTKFLFKGINKDFGFFSINYTLNTGALFGMFKGMNLVLIFVSIIILFLLLMYYHKHKKQYLGFGFLVGGLIGNVIDRIIFGGVIDFLDFKIWPVFNLADSAIVIGVLLVLFSFRKK